MEFPDELVSSNGSESRVTNRISIVNFVKLFRLKSIVIFIGLQKVGILMNDPIAIANLFFSVIAATAAIVIPLMLYRKTQKRELTITGDVVHPINRHGESWRVTTRIRARNTGSKPLYISRFVVLSPHKHISGYNNGDNWPKRVEAEDYIELHWTAECTELIINRVVAVDSLGNEWDMTPNNIKRILTDFSNMVRPLQESP